MIRIPPLIDGGSPSTVVTRSYYPWPHLGPFLPMIFGQPMASITEVDNSMFCKLKLPVSIVVGNNEEGEILDDSTQTDGVTANPGLSAACERQYS